MSYKSWKSLDDIQRAEAIERNLWQKLGRRPSKNDFRETGEYPVWMALYRYRRKLRALQQFTALDKKTILQLRREICVIKNNILMKNILTDILATLGQTVMENILDEICQKHYGSPWPKSPIKRRHRRDEYSQHRKKIFK